MRLVSTVESANSEVANNSVRSNMRSMPGHERVLVIFHYNFNNTRMMMLASEAGMRLEGIVDLAAHYEATRATGSRSGQGVGIAIGKGKARRKF